ncbi:MAG: SDR family oxidoreductase [Candidatus Heimdallarchaeota archaeon]
MNIIITGNTKGIGCALTEEFLESGDHIIISSRTQERVDQVVSDLKERFPDSQIFGFICDVGNEENVQELADFGKEKFGTIDIWINNAGTAGSRRIPIQETTPEEFRTILDTNVLGTLNGCKAALSVMLPQECGHIFNMLGWGSKGRPSPRSAAYGASKAATYQFTQTLVQECKTQGIGIHKLSPGMVLTDLLMQNADLRAKKIFNILAERPETVAKFLVPRIRDVKGTGKEISYLTKKRALWRFLTAWKRKKRFFDEEGNMIT